MQHAMKSLVASLYGICGDSLYGLTPRHRRRYHAHFHKFRLRDLCEELGHLPIWQWTGVRRHRVPEIGVELMKVVNERMSPIITEFEKWCESFVTKNRYAARVTDRWSVSSSTDLCEGH